MQALGVSEADFEESFIRSSGPGGQKVNKSSSCVYLVHIPTGLSVKCQRERSQSLNRFLARRLLLDKIEAQKKGFIALAQVLWLVKKKGFIAAEKETIEKIRRQKRKRSKRAKEKMLKDKHRQARKKELRGKVGPEDGE